MQELVKKHEFIKANFELVQRLVKSGDMSGKTMADYKIYVAFIARTEALKMERYESTAELCRCSSRTVMNAIKNMESLV